MGTKLEFSTNISCAKWLLAYPSIGLLVVVSFNEEKLKGVTYLDIFLSDFNMFVNGRIIEIDFCSLSNFIVEWMSFHNIVILDSFWLVDSLFTIICCNVNFSMFLWNCSLWMMKQIQQWSGSMIRLVTSTLQNTLFITWTYLPSNSNWLFLALSPMILFILQRFWSVLIALDLRA